MGQPIDIRETIEVDDVVVFETDRSLTGQLGVAVTEDTPDASSDDLPARLGREILAVDDAIDHVYVAMNDLVVRRRGGWDDAVRDEVAARIRGFLVHYGDEPPPSPIE